MSRQALATWTDRPAKQRLLEPEQYQFLLWRCALRGDVPGYVASAHALPPALARQQRRGQNYAATRAAR